jgi:hypothetical protein
MTDTLSLRDRYLALADGKELQILDVDGWVDFAPGRHPVKLANCFRVKPEAPASVVPIITPSIRNRYRALADGKTLQYIDPSTPASPLWVDYDPAVVCMATLIADPTIIFREKPDGAHLLVSKAVLNELQKLVAHAGAEPFDHLSGLLSQLSNIVAGAVLDRQQLGAIKAGGLSKLTPEQILAVGQSSLTLLQNYEKAQEWQGIRNKLAALARYEDVTRHLRQALIDVIRACGGLASVECSDDFLCAAPKEVRALADKAREVPSADALAAAAVAAFNRAFTHAMETLRKKS